MEAITNTSNTGTTNSTATNNIANSKPAVPVAPVTPPNPVTPANPASAALRVMTAVQKAETEGNALDAIANAIGQSNKAMEAMASAIRFHSHDISTMKSSIQSINTRLASDKEQYDALDERCKALEERKTAEDNTKLHVESVGNKLVLTIPDDLPVARPELPYAIVAKNAAKSVLNYHKNRTINMVNGIAIYYWFTDMCELLAACKCTGEMFVRNWIYKRFYAYSEKNGKLKSENYNGSRARAWCESGDVELLLDLVRATIETVYCELRGEKV